MNKFVKALALSLCFIGITGVFASCGGQGSEETGFVNVYREGDEFEFGKWQGSELVYKITQSEDGTQVDYSKLNSDTRTYSLISEINCDASFRYVNFEVSGTANKEVSVTLGDEMISDCFIGEQRFFLTETNTIYTYKLKNRVALPALKDIYLNVDPSSYGIDARGEINIHRSWFSDEVPENAVYEDQSLLKNYQFASGASWSRCNGWFVDTGWTNLRILPAPNDGVNVSTTGNNTAAAYASVIYPIEPDAGAQSFKLTFENLNNSVTDVAILLRGGQSSWNAAGGYWDYYEAQTEFWTNAQADGTQTSEVTIEYDLAQGMKTIGDHIDSDGLMMVVFFETHGNHPDQSARDGKFSLNILSSVCE